jgi:hypothetical protein
MVRGDFPRQLALLWSSVLAAGDAVQRVKLGAADTFEIAKFQPVLALRDAGYHLPAHVPAHSPTLTRALKRIFR